MYICVHNVFIALRRINTHTATWIRKEEGQKYQLEQVKELRCASLCSSRGCSVPRSTSLAEHHLNDVVWQRHLKLHPGLYYCWALSRERWQTGTEHGSRNPSCWEMQCFCWLQLLWARWDVPRVSRAEMAPAALVCGADGHEHLRNQCLLHNRQVQRACFHMELTPHTS